LFENFEEALKVYGFDYSVFIFFPPRKEAGEIKPCCPYFNVQEKIISAYLENELYKIGPVFEKAKTTGRPVIWDDIFQDNNVEEKYPVLKKLLEVLRGYGYMNALTIPTFGFSNSFGFISLASRDRELNSKDPDLVVLTHVCIDLLHQYMRITKQDVDGHPKLTDREKEVLRWVLQGKSNSVIASIMDISEHTVDTYVRRSIKKTQASSKWSAAMTAVLNGTLHY
jgi:DNA-binding CsgD family transcriptional regulator